jgi:hypothetical protein
MVEAWLQRATVPLDAARRSAFRVALRHPGLSLVVTRRDARLGALASVHAGVAFLLAVFCPVLLLVLGPVLLGVAHVAADVRYLVLRRALPSRARHAVWGLCLALLGLRGLEEGGLGSGWLGHAEWALTSVAVALAVLVGARASRSSARAAGGVGLAALLGALALSDPARARLVFAQAHNVVALLLWLLLFRRNRRAIALPLALVAFGAALLASGQLWGLTVRHGQTSAFGLHVLAASDWIAPGLRAEHAVGLTCAFVFLQSVHYAVWLVFVPQDDPRFEATPSFRASLRGLLRDFGGWWLGAIAVAAVVVVGLSFVDAVRTRHLYLSLAFFHGYLEVVLLGYFWARGEAPARALAGAG